MIQTMGGGDGDKGGLSSVGRQGTTGSTAEILKKVSTRLQDFEAQITAQLSTMESNYEKKLAHISRGASSMKAVDTSQ